MIYELMPCYQHLEIKLPQRTFYLYFTRAIPNNGHIIENLQEKHQVFLLKGDVHKTHRMWVFSIEEKESIGVDLKKPQQTKQKNPQENNSLVQRHNVTDTTGAINSNN